MGGIPRWSRGLSTVVHVSTPSFEAAGGGILCGVGDLRATDETEEGQE